jgi:hypothetical protein
MWRRLRWLALALVVLVIGGVAALVLTERPQLNDDRRAVDTRWAALRPSLEARYDKLAAALTVFGAAGGKERAVARDVGTAMSKWTTATHADDPDMEVEAANALEAQATRLRSNVLASPLLREAGDLTAAITAFDGSAPPAELVDAYNKAVTPYQRERRSRFGAPVARVLGFDERPALVLGG